MVIMLISHMFEDCSICIWPACPCRCDPAFACVLLSVPLRLKTCTAVVWGHVWFDDDILCTMMLATTRSRAIALQQPQQYANQRNGLKRRFTRGLTASTAPLCCHASAAVLPAGHVDTVRLLHTPLRELMAEAAILRDAGHRHITFSPKVRAGLWCRKPSKLPQQCSNSATATGVLQLLVWFLSAVHCAQLDRLLAGWQPGKIAWQPGKVAWDQLMQGI